MRTPPQDDLAALGPVEGETMRPWLIFAACGLVGLAISAAFWLGVIMLALRVARLFSSH